MNEVLIKKYTKLLSEKSMSLVYAQKRAAHSLKNDLQVTYYSDLGEAEVLIAEIKIINSIIDDLKEIKQ